MPSELFRYRVVKRCADVSLVHSASPVILLVLGVVSATVMLSYRAGLLFAPPNSEEWRILLEAIWNVRELGPSAGEHLAHIGACRNETHKLRSIPGFTPIGSFYGSAGKVDELPQLWNVLLGQIVSITRRPHCGGGGGEVW